MSVFPHVELWFKYWHSALEFSPRGCEDNLMVKTEWLQPPRGDHHFGFRNIRLVFNFCNCISFFPRAEGLHTKAVLFFCTFEWPLPHYVFITILSPWIFFFKDKRDTFHYFFPLFLQVKKKKQWNSNYKLSFEQIKSLTKKKPTALMACLFDAYCITLKEYWNIVELLLETAVYLLSVYGSCC